MGIQGDVAVLWKLLPYALMFTTVILVSTAFFISNSSLSLMSNQEVRADVIASSMAFINMRKNSGVELTWDYTPIITATTEGNFMMLLPKKGATNSPYPTLIPFRGSEKIGEVYYYDNDNIGAFYFSNRGSPEVYVK